MADDAEVVIIGADGTEHVFPAGFDPKRAAQIVSGPLSEQERAGAMWAGTKEALGATWPLVAGAAALPAAAAGLASAPIRALAGGMLRTLAHPATRIGMRGGARYGAVEGGLRGYQEGGLSGGLQGAWRGAIGGALGGGLIGRSVGAALGRAAVATEPTVLIAGQKVAASSLGPAARTLVLGPEMANRVAGLETLASGAGQPLGAGAQSAAAARAALLKMLQTGAE